MTQHFCLQDRTSTFRGKQPHVTWTLLYKVTEQQFLTRLSQQVQNSAQTACEQVGIPCSEQEQGMMLLRDQHGCELCDNVHQACRCPPGNP